MSTKPTNPTKPKAKKLTPAQTFLAREAMFRDIERRLSPVLNDLSAAFIASRPKRKSPDREK